MSGSLATPFTMPQGFNALSGNASQFNPMGGLPQGFNPLAGNPWANNPWAGGAANSTGTGVPSWLSNAWQMPKFPTAPPAAAPAQQQAPQPTYTGSNAAAQSSLDQYANALYGGSSYGQLGNGPIDPGTMFFLNAINPQLAQSMWGTPQFPLSGGWGVAAGGGGGGGSGGAGGGQVGGASGNQASAGVGTADVGGVGRGF
jgi:hypothetical protein